MKMHIMPSALSKADPYLRFLPHNRWREFCRRLKEIHAADPLNVSKIIAVVEELQSMSTNPTPDGFSLGMLRLGMLRLGMLRRSIGAALPTCSRKPGTRHTRPHPVASCLRRPQRMALRQPPPPRVSSNTESPSSPGGCVSSISGKLTPSLGALATTLR